ncbi:IclR family transcriptional regulator [Actinomycetospora cinnamomea]|uniref:DNA-binding IclR family transcriptional regulator n=1 Tax=Actinomycetospora cinnamomea TaxID=663609 RepID=A0A2U1FPP1_9PSEU|nr:IclR family transcriptional regulator C-terminal domain-containing protein [Actinomycetospora cinnamomea]PVZ14151.1 DNA-binding IclR family transcriptional regulator [Actinomycetospora cinnamomea]
MPGSPSRIVAPGALRVLRILAAHPEGVDLAALGGHLGRSDTGVLPVLQRLCRDGYAERTAAGAYRLRPGPSWSGTPAATAPRRELPAMLSDAVTELYGRARAWAYLAEWADDDQIDVLDIRGHQGLGLVPELSQRIPPTIAHALAVSKVLVAHSPDRRERLEPARWTAFTPSTITTPDAYDLELARIRRDGYALDREEYAAGLSCVCAPIADPGGRVAAAIAITLPTPRFRAELGRLVRDVTDVARVAHRQWYR